MALTFVYSLPRMNQGFWDDEELNVRTTLWGKFKPDKKTGEIEFMRFDWLETVYGYSKGPNSHTLFSILSRACEDVWIALARPTGFPLVEWPFRVPALLFGVLAVAAFAWLLKDFGMPKSGVVAAFLLGDPSLEYSLRQRSARLQPPDLSRPAALRFLATGDGHRAMEMVVRVCFHRVLSRSIAIRARHSS